MIDANGAARARAAMYGFLTEAFITLPDEAFVAALTSDSTGEYLAHYAGVGPADIREGAALVRSYLVKAKTLPAGTVAQELAVDRTRLLRPSGITKFRPPHEGLYIRKEDTTGALLKVKRFYKKAGILPSNPNNDSLDFLCTELDFLRQLCLREASGGDPTAAAAASKLRKEFVDEHIGVWVGKYRESAMPLAATDFYRGLLMLLDGFIAYEAAS